MHFVSSPTSSETERMLMHTFATCGSPHVIVSDNASSSRSSLDLIYPDLSAKVTTKMDIH